MYGAEATGLDSMYGAEATGLDRMEQKPQGKVRME